LYFAYPYGLQYKIDSKDLYAFSWPEPAFIASTHLKWSPPEKLVTEFAHDALPLQTEYCHIVTNEPMWIQILSSTNISNTVMGIPVKGISLSYLVKRFGWKTNVI